MKEKLYSTYLPNIKYSKQGPKCWRFIDMEEPPSAVGEIYPTKELLILDMRRYLTENWGLESQ